MGPRLTSLPRRRLVHGRWWAGLVWATINLLANLGTGTCPTHRRPSRARTALSTRSFVPTCVSPPATGVVLVADIYLPAHNGAVVDGAFPAIVERTPYLKDGTNYARRGHWYARRGYVTVITMSAGGGNQPVSGIRSRSRRPTDTTWSSGWPRSRGATGAWAPWAPVRRLGPERVGHPRSAASRLPGRRAGNQQLSRVVAAAGRRAGAAVHSLRLPHGAHQPRSPGRSRPEAAHSTRPISRFRSCSARRCDSARAARRCASCPPTSSGRGTS